MLYHQPSRAYHTNVQTLQWGVVLAGAADFARPASSLSITQNLALMTTGMIWTRWCFVIKPKNYFLASVNFSVGLVGLAQVIRVVNYQRSLTPAERANTELGQIEKAAEKVAEDPKKITDVVKGEKI